MLSLRDGRCLNLVQNPIATLFLYIIAIALGKVSGQSSIFGGKEIFIFLERCQKAYGENRIMGSIGLDTKSAQCNEAKGSSLYIYIYITDCG